MKTITFHCETITPMFLSGADQSKPELRPPSIKGAMRFWWRAMNAGKYPDIKDLKKAENEIFGGVEPAQRSKVIINVFPKTLETSMEKLNGEKVTITKWQSDKYTGEQKKITIPIDLLEYLCYGTYDYEKGNGNVFKRGYIKPNQKFEVEFRLTNETIERDIVDSFLLLSKFGGLGSRSRNGFGNFKICSSNVEIPNVYEILKDINKNEKGFFTSISDGTRLFRTNTGVSISNNSKNSWKSTLAMISMAYRNSRSAIEPKHNYYKRIYIASPLIADKKIYSFLERHSKSFFMSIDDYNGQQYGQILYLPYLYLEDNEQFNIDHRRKYNEINDKFCNLLISNNFNELPL